VKVEKAKSTLAMRRDQKIRLSAFIGGKEVAREDRKMDAHKKTPARNEE